MRRSEAPGADRRHAPTVGAASSTGEAGSGSGSVCRLAAPVRRSGSGFGRRLRLVTARVRRLGFGLRRGDRRRLGSGRLGLGSAGTGSGAATGTGSGSARARPGTGSAGLGVGTGSAAGSTATTGSTAPGRLGPGRRRRIGADRRRARGMAGAIGRPAEPRRVRADGSSTRPTAGGAGHASAGAPAARRRAAGANHSAHDPRATTASTTATSIRVPRPKPLRWAPRPSSAARRRRSSRGASSSRQRSAAVRRLATGTVVGATTVVGEVVVGGGCDVDATGEPLTVDRHGDLLRARARHGRRDAEAVDDRPRSRRSISPTISGAAGTSPPLATARSAIGPVSRPGRGDEVHGDAGGRRRRPRSGRASGPAGIGVPCTITRWRSGSAALGEPRRRRRARARAAGRRRARRP